MEKFTTNRTLLRKRSILRENYSSKPMPNWGSFKRRGFSSESSRNWSRKCTTTSSRRSLVKTRWRHTAANWSRITARSYWVSKPKARTAPCRASISWPLSKIKSSATRAIRWGRRHSSLSKGRSRLCKSLSDWKRWLSHSEKTRALE